MNVQGSAGNDVLAMLAQATTSVTQTSQISQLSNVVQTQPKLSDFIIHYFFGNGQKVQVSFDALGLPRYLMGLSARGDARDKILRAVAPYKAQNTHENLDIRFVHDHNDDIFGNLTYRLQGLFVSDYHKWFLKGGILKAFNDRWDFDWKAWGERQILAELATRGFSIATLGQGTSFDVEIVGSRPVQLSGWWDNPIARPQP